MLQADGEEEVPDEGEATMWDEAKFFEADPVIYWGRFSGSRDWFDAESKEVRAWGASIKGAAAQPHIAKGQMLCLFHANRWRPCTRALGWSMQWAVLFRACGC